MTQEDVYQKVLGLIKEGKLEIKRDKILIPIPEYFLDEEEIVRLYIIFNTEKQKITSEKANSIRGSLNTANVNLYTIRNETLPLTSDGYCRLGHIDNVQKGKKFKCKITLSMAFRQHMIRNHQREYDPSIFQYRIADFFKYLPQLKSIHERYNNTYFKEGYCCEEHDGDIDRHFEYRYKNAVGEIEKELSRITEK